MGNAFQDEDTPALRQHTTAIWSEKHEAGVLRRCADLLEHFPRDLVLEFKGALRHASRDHHGVEPGRYAVPVKVRRPNGADVVYYEVRGFDDARLADRRVVYRLAGRDKLMVPRRQVEAVFRRIAALGPDTAAALFETVGTCRVCGGRLTSLRSRARGVGRWCAEHVEELDEGGAETELEVDRPPLVGIPGGKP